QPVGGSNKARRILLPFSLFINLPLSQRISRSRVRCRYLSVSWDELAGTTADGVGVCVGVCVCVCVCVRVCACAHLPVLAPLLHSLPCQLNPSSSHVSGTPHLPVDYSLPLLSSPLLSS